jgi:glycosyltransferase involved in cell wall biosynthesis
VSGAPRRLVVLNERDLLHPQAGGAEVHCFEVFRRLVARGDDVTLLASGFAGAARRETVQGLTVLRVGARVSYYPAALRAYRQLRAVAPIDAVVEDLNKFPFFARLWVREPVVVLVHHLFGRTAFQQVAWPIAAATFAAEALVPRLYRGLPVVAVSPSTRDELVAGGMRAADVHVIPNGLDHALYAPGDGRRAPVPTVLALGRIEPYKRTEMLVDAVATVPGARLVVAGSGTGMEALRAHVERRGLAARVDLLGFVDDATKVRLLREAHVVATASRKEGWGLTVVEAAACGTPAVAFDVPGLRDAIRDGETGVLVPGDHPAALAAALRRVLEDAALRERLAAGAVAWAARFTWERAAAEISALIDAAIAARGDGGRSAQPGGLRQGSS